MGKQDYKADISGVIETPVESGSVTGVQTFELNAHAPRNVTIDYFYFVDSSGDIVDATAGSVEITAAPVLGVPRSMTHGKFDADSARDVDWNQPYFYGRCVQVAVTLTGITGAAGFRAFVSQGRSTTPIKNNLPRDGEPAYRTLSTDPFPTPTLEEAGTTLIHTDTGSEFIWTGTHFIQTVVKGIPIARSYLNDTADGLIVGESLFAVVARNPSVGQTFADCWGEGGEMVYPTSAETWELVSDDAADTSAGTGARTVLVLSLDENLLEQSQVVTMNGTTAVTLTGTHLRPDAIINLTAGSHGNNEGTIKLQVSGAGNVRNVMLPDIGRSHDTHFTVPSNKTAKVLTTLILYPKGGAGTFRNRFRLDVADAAWVTGSVLSMYQNIVPFNFESRPALPSGTDLNLQVKSDTGQLDVSVLFEMILKDN